MHLANYCNLSTFVTILLAAMANFSLIANFTCVDLHRLRDCQHFPP